MLTDAELDGNIYAGAAWSRLCDFPDTVGWKDLNLDPALTRSVIRARNSGELAPGRSHCIPVPKGDGLGYRQFTLGDPYDEIVYRALVGRVAEQIDLSLGFEVSSYRLASLSPAWTTYPYRYAQSERANDVLNHLDSGFYGVGTLDIRSYYPSIQSSLLGVVLDTAGCDWLDVNRLCAFLEAWQKDWGVRGVPVGPEASALLGNVFLVSVDQALRDVGVSFSRYTDDYRLWLEGEVDFQQAYQAVAHSLDALSLKLNGKKTRHIRTRPIAKRILQDAVLDALSAQLQKDKKRGGRLARHVLDQELSRRTPIVKRIKFCLGVLRNQSDAYGVGIAIRSPETLQFDPASWGRYLGVMHEKRLVDVDFLIQNVSRPNTKDTAAVAYHLLRSLSKRRLGKEHGRKVGEIALSESGVYAPVASVAVESWAKSDGWKSGYSVDAVSEIGDSQRRRALALTLRHAPPGEARSKGLRKIKATSIECRPAVKWIENSTTSAA